MGLSRKSYQQGWSKGGAGQVGRLLKANKIRVPSPGVRDYSKQTSIETKLGKAKPPSTKISFGTTGKIFDI